MPKKILIIDDEEDIIELLQYNLNKEGYKVLSALTGEIGLKLAKKETPDGIILDLMLPGIDGLEVCRAIKNDDRTSNIPIIMLTAKGEETDIIVGLELGADDYITKPFSIRQLLARLKAVIRRAHHISKSTTIIKIENLVINSTKFEVLLNGKLLNLTSTEFYLLKYLAENPGHVFTRDQLLDKVWGEDAFLIDRVVDVNIRRLRKKLGKEAKLITTVRGVGYKFKS